MRESKDRKIKRAVKVVQLLYKEYPNVHGHQNIHHCGKLPNPVKTDHPSWLHHALTITESFNL